VVFISMASLNVNISLICKRLVYNSITLEVAMVLVKCVC
jgi:hypothetical protein